MKKALVIIVALLVVLLGGALWLYSTLDDQTAASVTSVVDEFRELKGPDSDPEGRPGQGVYEYTVTGNERIKRGSIDVSRTLPSTAVAMVYTLPSGEYEVRTKFSEEHIEVARYDRRAQGTFLTFARTTLRVGPFSSTKERVWSPALIRNPATTTPGPISSGSYAAGDSLTMNVTITVQEPENVDVGGTSVPATVVRFDQKASGEFTGDRTETFWWAKNGLLIRYTISSSLKGSPDLDFFADQRLMSLEPQV